MSVSSLRSSPSVLDGGDGRAGLSEMGSGILTLDLKDVDEY